MSIEKRKKVFVHFEKKLFVILFFDFQSETQLLPNPYFTHETDPICVIPPVVAEMIYKRDVFLKKIIEDSGTCEESLRLLRFLLWENPDVTSIVLNEIITLVRLDRFYFLFSFFSKTKTKRFVFSWRFITVSIFEHISTFST